VKVGEVLEIYSSVAESDLLDQTQVTAAAALNIEAMEADAVFTY